MIRFESKFTILYREERGICRVPMSRTAKKVRIRLINSFEHLRMLADSTALELWRSKVSMSKDSSLIRGRNTIEAI